MGFPLGGTAIVEAQDLNRLLRGNYAFSHTLACVQTAPDDAFGALPGLVVPGGGATTRTYFVEGVFSYDGDGTGSTTFTSLLINHDLTNPGDTPVVFSIQTADLTFTVNPDRSFTQEFVNLSFTILIPLPGITGTLMSGPFEGQIGDGGRTLIFKETEPNVETLTVDQTGTIAERICGRSGFAVKM